MGLGYDTKKMIYSAIGLLLLFFIIVFINVIMSYANLRWDLTEDRIYSLSKGTRHIISTIKTPVTIKFFYSRSNPHVPTYIKLFAKRVQEFLEEYEYASKGKIRLEIYDPRPDSDEEEWAEKYGLKAMETGEGDKVYCGLVFAALDRIDKIAFLDPSEEELLEYKITRAIYNLQHPEKRVIGIISGLPVFGGKNAGREWLFIKELKKTYKVKEIKKDAKKIDNDVDLLLVIYPRNIGAALEYAIDQFIVSGKNALIFVDPYCLSDTKGTGMLKKASLQRLFSAWGIGFDPGKVIADLQQSTYIRSHNMVKESPVIITAREKAFNKSLVLTSGLDNMLLPATGAIEKKSSCKLGFEPLIHSSKDSDLVSIFFMTMGTDYVRKRVTPKGKEYPMAVMLNGSFKSAFPEGPPKGVDNKAHIKEGKRKSSVIFVGDSDLLSDDFYVQRTSFLGFVIKRIFNDNLNFLLNACEFLTGNQDLISLRTRGKFDRPFTTVLKLKAKAQRKWLEKEKELEQQVETLNKRLQELQKRKKKSERFVLSPEQEKEIERFRQQKVRIQHELKEVRKRLRADIERLGLILKFINMFLMPFIISLFGIGLAIYRQRKAYQGK